MVNGYCFVILQLGEITEIRLIKNQMGKSKGFAYIEFKNEVRENLLNPTMTCFWYTSYS